MIEYFCTIDIAVLTWLNHNYIPYSIPFLKFISFTTTFVSIALVSGVFIFSLVRKSKFLWQQLLILSTVLVLTGVMSQVMKSLIYRERPFIKHAFIEKRSEGGGSSFPSGHSMEAFAIVTAFSMLFSKKKIIIPMFFWAMTVAYSRISLGVHYPSDVLAGILIGIFIGWIVPHVIGNYPVSERTKK